MQYQSTRGSAPQLDFEGVTLTGLATDGGLYLPVSFPSFTAEDIRGFQSLDYPQLASKILARFTGDSIPTSDLEKLVSAAYSNFYHDAIAPVKQLDDNVYFMELFHGPTLAFKDYALQMLGQLFHYFLGKSGDHCTIVGATSGDTGSAAIAGIRGLDNVNLFMLHPNGRVSDVQRRQMTTVKSENICNLAVRGTFDDCQNMVKALFNDLDFRNKHNLSAVNSINWARIAAQVVYYFRAALVLGAPDRQVSFSVPTGNFGNVLAGYIAKQMGLPIDRLIIGSNKNDILTRFFENGIMEQQGVEPSLSPSMDIQISSNFERYLFLLLDRDSEQLRECMTQFAESGRFSIDDALMSKAREDFSAYRLGDEEVSADIKSVYDATGEVIEPHSVIGVSAARREPSLKSPVIVLGTAHPAKFPEAIMKSVGVSVELPAHSSNLMSLEEHYRVIDNNLDELKTVIDNH